MIRGLIEIYTAHRISREMWTPQQANLGEDRRVFYRVAVQIPCQMIHSSFGLESAGTAVNVGLGGTGVLASVNWSEGSRIRLRLDPLTFEADAVIVYRNEENSQFHYGVKFQRLGLLQILRLRRSLKQNYSGRLTL